MTDDDDALRRAFADPSEETNPHTVLQMLRPTMKRARSRRRVAMTALAATLVTAGAAGVLAMVPDAAPTSLRTSSISDDEGSVDDFSTAPNRQIVDGHPEVDASERPEQDQLDTANTTLAATTSDVAVTAAETPNRSPAPEPTPAIPATTSSTTVWANPPSAPAPEQRPSVPTTTETPVPATTQAPQATPTFQTITSACGGVVVMIDAGTVRIDSIQPQPGFESSVADNGPISIELVFTGSRGRCELHAELRSSGLDVEVQDDVGER